MKEAMTKQDVLAAQGAAIDNGEEFNLAAAKKAAEADETNKIGGSHE
jgi:hypothetical protein